MVSDYEKQQIIHSIMRSFDKFSQQHYKNLFERYPKKEGSLGMAVIEDNFLKRRAIDINSYIHILNKRAESKPVIKHRKILIESAIRSIIQDSFELSEIGRGQDDRGGSYTDRQVQRLIRERYRDVFFEKTYDNSNDARTKHVSTVFSENNLPASHAGDMARAYLDAAAIVTRNPSGVNIRKRLYLNSILRLAFPQFLSDMLEFRNDCRAVFENFGKRNDRIDYLREQLVENAGLLVGFYSPISSMLDVTWFRTKTKGEQHTLLRPAQKVKYDKKDAQKAREILTDIYGEGLALYMLDRCGNAFLQYDRPHAATLVFTECANMANDSIYRGMEWQNVAVTYRVRKNFKLALGAMKKALLHFRTVGDAYRICNALQLMGEFQWHLGFKDASWRSFNEATRHSETIDESKRWAIWANIGMSFGRLGEMPLRRKYLVKALEMIPEEQTDTILRISQLIHYEHPITPDTKLPPALSQEIDMFVGYVDAVVHKKDGVPPATSNGFQPGTISGQNMQDSGGDV